MPNFSSIGSGVSEPQVAENRHFPLTRGIALTTVYALTCYTVISKQVANALPKLKCKQQTVAARDAITAAVAADGQLAYS